MLTISSPAFRRLSSMVRNASPSAGIVGIRFGIKAGGCSGFEYLLKPIQASEIRSDDIVLSFGIKIYIDLKSAPLVAGTFIDYNLMGFFYINPNADSICGCGLSFQPKK